MKGKARKRNKGWFKAGTDARRHRFTVDECRRGYQVLMAGGKKNLPAGILAWAWRRVRGYYRHNDQAAELDAEAVPF
jgi:hypothetical protein